MWAHVGDQVSEYVVYVNNIETTIVSSTYIFHSETCPFSFEIVPDYGEGF